MFPAHEQHTGENKKKRARRSQRVCMWANFFLQFSDFTIARKRLRCHRLAKTRLVPQFVRISLTKAFIRRSGLVTLRSRTSSRSFANYFRLFAQTSVDKRSFAFILRLSTERAAAHHKTFFGEIALNVQQNALCIRPARQRRELSKRKQRIPRNSGKVIAQFARMSGTGRMMT